MWRRYSRRITDLAIAIPHRHYRRPAPAGSCATRLLVPTRRYCSTLRGHPSERDVVPQRRRPPLAPARRTRPRWRHAA